MLGLLVRAFGVLLLLTALALSLARAPDRPVQTLVARWAPPPSDFVEVRGQVVHLRDEGPRDDPLPVVLIHGTGASLHTWEGWVRALKGRHRVISLDMPGFGLTGPWTGQYPADVYDADSDARFLLDVLDTLKVQRAVLAGNSLGGEIAWRLALLAPQRVAALVLVDATGMAMAPQSVPIGFLLARTPVIGRLSEYALPRAVVAQGLADLYGDRAKVTPPLVDRYFELTLRDGNRRALGQRLRQWDWGAQAARVAEVKQPTLLLWGGRDRLVPPAAGRQFAQAIAGSTFTVFDDLGHVPQEEDPARTVQPVLAFLAGLR